MRAFSCRCFGKVLRHGRKHPRFCVCASTGDAKTFFRLKELSLRRIVILIAGYRHYRYHSMNPGSCHPRSGFPKVLFCSSKPHANGYLIKHKNAFHLADLSRAMLWRRNASRMLLGLPTCFAFLFSCGSVYKKQRGACAPLHCPIHFNSESRLLLPLGTAWCKGHNSTHAG